MSRRCAWEAPLQDPPGSTKGIVTEDDIRKESDRLDGLGVDRPIKDPLELDQYLPKTRIDKGTETTDEETELPGTKRPKKGEGWWGVGPTLLPLRKGAPKPFVDGAGLCSPGRWPVTRRRLPNNDLATKLQKIVLDRLKEYEGSLRKATPARDLRHILLTIAVGKMERLPFPLELIERVRADLRITLKEAGFGDGLPREGDVVQSFEVRLIQALLEAMGDPDHHFCTWWALGVWLGSPSRKLPRTPAVFDRKTKWRFQEIGEEDRGDWQHNYSSLDEHASLVQKQFEAEEAEGLMSRQTLREALEEYGAELMIAATGAIEKKGRTDEVRVIYDGSHGRPQPTDEHFSKNSQ